MQIHDYDNNHSRKTQPQPQPQTKNTPKTQAKTSKKEKKTEKPSFFAGFCELDVLISTHPWGVAPASTSKIARFRFQPIILKCLKNRLFAPIVSSLTVEFHSSKFFLKILQSCHYLGWCSKPMSMCLFKTAIPNAVQPYCMQIK